MLFIFSTPELIRYLWQLKDSCFPALVFNMCCSIKNLLQKEVYFLIIKSKNEYANKICIVFAGKVSNLNLKLKFRISKKRKKA
jgi:hypothetical protein